MIENKKELLEALKKRYRVSGDITVLALSYLVNDICPDDRTTKHVFKNRGERHCKNCVHSSIVDYVGIFCNLEERWVHLPSGSEAEVCDKFKLHPMLAKEKV